MKKVKKWMVLLLAAFSVTGCGSNDGNRNAANNNNSVDKIISEQIEETASQSGDGADYDLTAMSSDMVYATVYQMMTDSDAYIGKTIRMGGLYHAVYYEATEKYYHYCIIQDATACCAQGIEFVWGDGDHVYPDDYPQDYAHIVVQGVFEPYQEDGDSNLYCRLNSATLEVVNP
ncbi:MAG: hypothetical protein Q4C50_08900 [Eubacteriales bacterium]|nr:hypothetical protein [Eubacteriales bacterium]